jgi:hypothetical protein
VREKTSESTAHHARAALDPSLSPWSLTGAVSQSNSTLPHTSTHRLHGLIQGIQLRGPSRHRRQLRGEKQSERQGGGNGRAHVMTAHARKRRTPTWSTPHIHGARTQHQHEEQRTHICKEYTHIHKHEEPTYTDERRRAHAGMGSAHTQVRGVCTHAGTGCAHIGGRM